MVDYYKYIVICFFVMICSVNSTLDSNRTKESTIDHLSLVTVCSTTSNDLSTTGKLPKPIEPTKKKQTIKRLLVSKRCTSSNLNVTLVTNSASNNLVVSQRPILPHHSQISGYSQALISHSSLYYLY